MCMRKITGWHIKATANNSNENLYGFKLIRNTGSIAAPIFQSINFDFKWKEGVLVAKNMGESSARGDAFFHMYTSILDAAEIRMSKWCSWATDPYDKNFFIIPLKPIGKLVFGLENNSTIHTFGAKKVMWGGSLIQPSDVPGRINIYNIIDAGALALGYNVATHQFINSYIR